MVNPSRQLNFPLPINTTATAQLVDGGRPGRGHFRDRHAEEAGDGGDNGGSVRHQDDAAARFAPKPTPGPGTNWHEQAG